MKMFTDTTIINFFLHRSPTQDGPFACIPMGPMYLCSALEEAGFSVDFHDYQLQSSANPYDPENISEFLENAQSDFIGISCMTNMLPFLVLGLRKFKRKRPDAFVVLGGSGSSGVATDIIRAFPEIDAVVSGEGEEAIIEVLQVRRGERSQDSVSGLTYRDGCVIRSNPVRPRRYNLDQIPYPAYHHLDLNHYFKLPVLTARGCPYRCVFCDIAPNWDRRVAKRSIDAVLTEMTMHLQQYDVDTFTILDDVFSLDRRRVVEFCRKILGQKLRFHWSCMCRVDLLDDELIALMYAAGCRKVFLGIESGSGRVRKIAGKGLSINNVEEVIAKTANHFEVAASFILGFPFETLDEFYETILLIIYCFEKGAKPQMSILSPLPQAPLTKSIEYEKEFDPDVISGMVFPRYQERASHLLKNILTNEVQELIRNEPDIFSGFYYFKEGYVREKLELATKFGLRL